MGAAGVPDDALDREQGLQDVGGVLGGEGVAVRGDGDGEAVLDGAPVGGGGPGFVV